MTSYYAFFSVKGGVGKSALTAASAVAFARGGRPVAVVDGDLTGTSLGDGLALRAPELSSGSGLSWTDPSPQRLSRGETLARRRDLSEGKTKGLPYFDALITSELRHEFDPGAIAWLHDDLPGIRWYPSSPLPRDTARSAESMMRDPIFGKRIVWAISKIGEVLEGGTVLVDLPPGMFGVGTWVAQIRDLTPVLVTTDDRNDLYRSVHEFFRLRKAFPTARWILNRNRRTPEEVRGDLRGYLGHWFPGIEAELREVGWSSDLEHIFRNDRLDVSPELGRRVLQILEDR